jgi:hypothetical protein
MRYIATTLTIALLLLSSTAAAQTWADSRTTPILSEIVAIDATGEPGWLYGEEDLAGDGVAEFKQQEQSIDIRTVYASTDSARFWVRLYVSDPNVAGGNVTAFVFIDADHSTATGGTAEADEINPLLTNDPSDGGYDYVIEIGGNGSIGNIWEWRDAQTGYQGTNPTPAQAEAETDQDVDPIEIGSSEHGYLQAMVDLGQVGLTPACDAMLFVRSVHTSTGGDGDLDVGQVGPCVPADTNGDDVPDILTENVDQCADDDQCPGGGICVDGRCVIPQTCVDDTDCDADEECSPQGICMPIGGEQCTDDADCGALICVDGQCVPCTVAPEQCGPGRRCAVDGRCVDDSGMGVGGFGAGGAPPEGGLPFQEGVDEVQGGALNCSARAPRTAGSVLAILYLALLGSLAWRRRDH